jgi:AcrR family transcriptional regulator
MKISDKIDYSAERRILNAAKGVFSEKGYDGASMTEIAKRANVNKALLYYYFDSKKGIFEELVTRYTKEVTEMQDVFVRTTKEMNVDSFKEYYDQLFVQLGQRKEILRILMIETLKGASGAVSLFELMEPAIRNYSRYSKAFASDDKENEKLQIRTFFFSIVPIYIFLMLGDKWADHNGLDKQKVEKDFLDSLKEIYINTCFKRYFDGDKTK